MNALFAIGTVVDASAADVALEDQSSLTFIEDASYEFVGGGMAANGI